MLFLTYLVYVDDDVGPSLALAKVLLQQSTQSTSTVETEKEQPLHGGQHAILPKPLAPTVLLCMQMSRSLQAPTREYLQLSWGVAHA